MPLEHALLNMLINGLEKEQGDASLPMILNHPGQRKLLARKELQKMS